MGHPKRLFIYKQTESTRVPCVCIHTAQCTIMYRSTAVCIPCTPVGISSKRCVHSCIRTKFSILNLVLNLVSTHTYRGDTLQGGGLLCNYCLQLFSADISIHRTHDPSMGNKRRFPRSPVSRILSLLVEPELFTVHPADLRARRERARARRTRAVHVIFKIVNFMTYPPCRSMPRSTAVWLYVLNI
jgi:hypothetical protein